LEGAVPGRPGHGEQLGEVGDGVVAGGVHAPELGLLPGREFGLAPAESAFRPGHGHAFPGAHAQQAAIGKLTNSMTVAYYYATGIGQVFGTGTALEREFTRLGGQAAITNAYLAALMLLPGLAAAAYATSVVLRLRAEETGD
jgi:hypothetical protein